MNRSAHHMMAKMHREGISDALTEAAIVEWRPTGAYF